MGLNDRRNREKQSRNEEIINVATNDTFIIGVVLWCIKQAL